MIKMRDFVADDIDVSIQWGFGDWKEKEYDATLLVRDPKVICCVPALARQITSPQDLLKVPLIHLVHARRLWYRVLCHLGLEAPEIVSDTEFQDAATVRRGTISGIGVGLVSRNDAEDWSAQLEAE
jgi:LysR family glycine cleavage system transcriptional activator